MATTRPRIYLAGPTVFRPDAAAEGARLKAICEAAGCEGLYPGDIPMPLGPPVARVLTVRQRCLDMLERADAVVADLSPWRGPHVDDGTAFELGWAAARRLPIYGYAADLRPLKQRVPHLIDADGHLHDEAGMLVEDFGEPFNAMIAGSLESLFATPEEAIARAAGRIPAGSGSDRLPIPASVRIRRMSLISRLRHPPASTLNLEAASEIEATLNEEPPLMRCERCHDWPASARPFCPDCLGSQITSCCEGGERFAGIVEPSEPWAGDNEGDDR